MLLSPEFAKQLEQALVLDQLDNSFFFVCEKRLSGEEELTKSVFEYSVTLVQTLPTIHTKRVTILWDMLYRVSPQIFQSQVQSLLGHLFLLGEVRQTKNRHSRRFT
eukprot:TRINITY_DN6978_c0_g2_i2.p2 TRINITY_DN6978_c0_g2~~TRINITY_DN6978_c0_g2_i2.p2  ORF type:complete len:106 (-),score=18.81 TRINITY_DN6978_c0_g2_i2:1244-1561(-)